jgi:hypothetical protein
MTEAFLRQKARTALQEGKLPKRQPDRMWGGPGVGARCSVCDLPISKYEMEFEIQYARDSNNPGLDHFHAHVRCFAAWELEREPA